ncbi:MAG TPA: TRAP transporter small permease subunit [Burkholderiaceae bacterium]|jgi:TRAP-type mannitol/chloroaromatic compound transport system permease small subunit
MQPLLTLSKLIDRLNEIIGQGISWALLAAVLICSGNAIIRYSFNMSSNAWLEIQWYLFSAIFLLASSYTLRRNEHVRIDVVADRFSKRTQVWIDVFGFLFFLLPMTLVILYYAIPFAYLSFTSKEMSGNSGGLILWPAKILIPIGFLLLSLQGISELIKRVGYLMGMVDASAFEKQGSTPEEEIEAIKAASCGFDRLDDAAHQQETKQ